MKIAVLFSGGKDSTLALYKAMRFHKVSCLVSLISKNKESYMFHTPNIELTKVQAQAIGLPLIQKITEGKKENELKDLKKALIIAKEKFKVKGVVSGAIRSIYQATRIQEICNNLGLWCFNPLWLKDQIELLNEIVENNFEVIISGVFAFPLDKNLLGKVVDRGIIKKLKGLEEKYKLSPCGEGGEIETTVVDAPFFKKRIKIVDYKIFYENYIGVFQIKDIKLIEK